MPPIPVFWFYDKQNLEVWTVMGPDSRYHPKGCYKDNITGDLNAASDFDYLIERRSLKNDKKQLRRFGGTLGSITKPITKKDHHAALDLRYIRKESETEVFIKEYLLFVDHHGKCGVFFVSKRENKGGKGMRPM